MTPWTAQLATWRQWLDTNSSSPELIAAASRIGRLVAKGGE